MGAATESPSKSTKEIQSNEPEGELSLPPNDASIEVLPAASDAEKKTRKQLTSAREGQGIFRERLEAFLHGCRLTGLANKAHL